MSVTLDQIAAQVIALLRVSDPELDTSVGTTSRKIIDANSEAIAEAYLDNQVSNYQYDIDSMTDAALDDFVQLFGMARLAAKRSSGIVTFFRSSNLSASVTIPVGTSVTADDGSGVSVQTISPTVLDAGATSADVPAQAVTAGASGNVGANTLTSGSVTGVDSVTNVSPFTGGTDQETDAQLRARWKATVFRSLAGTAAMYQGIATDDADCYLANVIGASQEWRENIQIVGTTGTTTVQNARFVYSEPVFLGTDIDAGDLLIPGVDYTFNHTVNPPTVTINSSAASDGDILEIDFQYEPTSSRNDVGNGITNRVDVWCGGQRATTATQTVIFQAATQFTSENTDTLYNQNFVYPDDTHPDAGMIFVPLAFGPILTVPSTITVGSTTYAQATYDHPLGTIDSSSGTSIYYGYQIVHQDAPYGWTPTSNFGLAWYAGEYTDSSGHVPSNGSAISIDGDSGYTFNSMITDINAQVANWRLLGVDAQVHAAKQVKLILSVAVVLSSGASIDAVEASIFTAVQSLISATTFDGQVQVSDLLQAIHGADGVDNVRFLHGSDYPSWNSSTPNAFGVGIQKVVNESYDPDTQLYTPVIGKSYVDSTGRPYDLFFDDYELPVLWGVNVVQKAANSFGVA